MKKISLIVSSVLISVIASAQNKQLTLSNVMDGTFYATGASSVTPMADGEHYLTSEDGRLILKHSFKTGQVTDTILNLSTARGEHLAAFESFILSPTEDIILLQTNTSKIFRRSLHWRALAACSVPML